MGSVTTTAFFIRKPDVDVSNERTQGVKHLYLAAFAAYGIKAVDLGGKYSSEVFRQYVPDARVVKAFNHLDVNVLPEPHVAGGQRVLFYSGDDAGAKAEVRKIIEATGFFPVDLGALDVGGSLASLAFGSLAAHNFIKI